MSDTIKNRIAKNITKYRKIANLNQKELAQKLKVTQSRLSNWETGANSMDIDTLYKICQALNVSINDMYGIYPDADITLNFNEQQLIEKYRKLDAYSKETIEYLIERELDKPEQFNEDNSNYNIINYYSDCRVSAGHGTITLDNPPTDTIKIPNIDKFKNANYAVMVTGDSMSPLYNDKDIVVVEITQAINVGEIGIFSHNSDSYIKEYGDKQLISLNPKHKPIDIDETTRCMGRVLGKV